MYRSLFVPLLLLLPLLGFAHGDMQHMQEGQQAAANPAALAAGAAFDNQGRLWIASAHDNYIWLRHSDDYGKTLSTPVKVNQQPEPIFVSAEISPKVAVGPDGTIYVTWSVLPKADPPHWWKINVRFARSTDDGKHFSKPVTINDDRGRYTHSYDALAVDHNGRVYIAWLDARNNKAAAAANQSYRGLSVYYTWSDDDGQSFASNHKLADHSCECCRIALSPTPNGQMAAFYRMVYSGQIRDHAFSILRTQGQPKQPERATFSNWHITACPEHGPGLAIGNDGIRHGVWFEASNGPAIWYGQLQPGQPPARKLKVAGPGASHADIAVHDKTVWLTWNQVSDTGYKLKLRVSHDSGKHFAQERVIASASGAVDSPQLMLNDGHAYVAWNTAAGFRLVAVQPQRDATLVSLTMDDIPNLLATPKQGKRVVEFWALYCVYCEPNLSALAKLEQAYPERMRLVTVATDGMAQRETIMARLQHMHMATYPARAYASTNPARMNYRIAKNWGGTLPFTVVIDANGSRHDYLGKLTTAQLKQIAPD